MRAMSIVAFVSAVFVVTPVLADAQTKVLPAAAISAAEIQALMGPRKPNTLPNIRVVARPACRHPQLNVRRFM